MIEDKKLGLKLADNSTEAFWSELVGKIEKDIENSKHTIEISEHVLKLAKSKLNK